MPKALLTAIIPLAGILFLQGCLTQNTSDLLMQSTSQLTLRLGPVHVSPRDSGFSIQGSMAVTGGRGGTTRVQLIKNTPPQDQTGMSRVVGPTDLSTDMMQISGNVSLFPTDHLRLGMGAEA